MSIAPTSGTPEPPAQAAGWRARFGPLSEPVFRRYWLGQAVSHFGDRIAPVALAFAVLEISGSATDLGLVVAAGTVPLAVLLLVGGVWADRLDRRRVMLVADAVRAVVQGVAAVLLLTGEAQIWQLAVLAAMAGAAQAFFEPAGTGMVPQVVSPARLGQANALVGLSHNAAMIVAPLVAGALVAAASPGAAIAVDAATFVVSAAFLWRLRPRPSEPSERSTFVTELVGGFREVTSRSWLGAMIIGFTVYHAIVLPALLVLGPVVSERRYEGATTWAVITSAFGVGAVLGALAALKARPRRPIVWCSVLLVGGSVQPLIVGTWLPLAAMAGLIAISGASISVLFVIWDTTLAREIPPQALSRVSSFDFFGSVVGMPLGFAVIGPVSDWLGLTETMVIASAIGVAWALVTAALPSVRGLREDPASRTTRTGEPVPTYHAPHPPTDPSPAPPTLA
ncbi:MFS transporter [Angustibacter sp. McL0619]|uniref:MFS transporter n=1 Tax=Angustibacter sp. McL0619 TaxID=3415676 RepID=UPI003CF07411